MSNLKTLNDLENENILTKMFSNEITIFEDKSYTFILKSPPASILLAKFANVKKGAAQPNKEVMGTVTLEQVKEIATIKMNDLNTKKITIN